MATSSQVGMTGTRAGMIDSKEVCTARGVHSELLQGTKKIAKKGNPQNIGASNSIFIIASKRLPQHPQQGSDTRNTRPVRLDAEGCSQQGAHLSGSKYRAPARKARPGLVKHKKGRHRQPQALASV